MAHTDPNYRAGWNDALDALTASVAANSETSEDNVPMQTLGQIVAALQKQEPRHLLGVDAE